MGRLTLHMLLSFAQFEREVTAERIRDKVAASKRKGLWMGGRVPLGYEKDERTLRINAAEAKTVRTLYALYRKHGTPRSLSQSKYSCVDPPPPSTLISRGEVSQRCWHRGEGTS